MKQFLGLAGAALAASLMLSAPALAQAGNIPGVGGARAANQPSTVGLSSVEGRRGMGAPGAYHSGRHYGYRSHRHHGWRRHHRY